MLRLSLLVSKTENMSTYKVRVYKVIIRPYGENKRCWLAARCIRTHIDTKMVFFSFAGLRLIHHIAMLNKLNKCLTCVESSLME